MPKLSARLATLFAELRRRKVVRITIAYGVFAADKFVAVAERMMARRHVPLSAKQRRFLTYVHEVCGNR